MNGTEAEPLGSVERPEGEVPRSLTAEIKRRLSRPAAQCCCGGVEPAQGVIDALVAAGVKAILNYAPIAALVPPHVHIKDIDPVLSLQSMTFYLKGDLAQAPPK